MIADKNVLTVDADPAARVRIAHSLGPESVEIREVASGREALEACKQHRPDLLITELLLPDLSGFGLCRRLREEPVLADVAVLMLTSHASEIDRILAFEMGVDDFLAKPFFARELSARVRALLRRSGLARPAPEDRRQSFGPLEVDGDARMVTFEEHAVDLTPREFDLLMKLVRAGGRVLSRKQLVEEVWGSERAAGERAVDTHVKTIRRKLGHGKRYVETIRGVGYRFNPDRPR